MMTRTVLTDVKDCTGQDIVSADGGTGDSNTTMFHGSTVETHQCLQREHCQSLWAAWQRAAWPPPASQASPVDPAQRATDSTAGQVTGCTGTGDRQPEPLAARQTPLTNTAHKGDCCQGW